MSSAAPLSTAELAARVAADIPPGSYVNLGIGLPTAVSDHLPEGAGVVLHTENGMLGMGPAAMGEDVDPELINAGKIPVTELPGASYFHHGDSFAMMRGGHIDVCVMGAFEVSVSGDLANWSTGAPDAIPAVGGAMDLAVGARLTWVMMNLLTKHGQPKLVETCSLPLTGVGCVSRVYSDQAVIDLTNDDGTRASRPRVLGTFGTTVAELRDLLGIDLTDATEGHAP